MVAADSSSTLLSIISLLALFLARRGCLAATFTFTNNCGYMVWPGILSNDGTAQLPSTGFPLDKGESRSFDVPLSWSGRLWGRTLCSTDASTGAFSCITGDCGSGKVDCSGGGPALPVTLAEFALGRSKGLDSYDVSLLDGYNVPMLVAPQGAAVGRDDNCTATGCLADLNAPCPTDLKVVVSSSDGRRSEGVACKSACEAFGSPEYCCSGEYGNPSTCRPSAYSQFFKSACPRAYSYKYDDATSIFACPTGVDYVITFCRGTYSSSNQNFANTGKSRMDHKGPARPSNTHGPTKASPFGFTVWGIMAIVDLIVLIYLIQENPHFFFNFSGQRSRNFQFNFRFNY